MDRSKTADMLGKYGILEEIGHGGFATVYRALDMTLDREVALKVLHPQLLTDAGFVERFQREACALARLRHPQIVTIYEVGEAEQRLYIAMELARGSNLAQAIAERGHIPWAEVLALLEPICAALDYAHGKGMVHRDLKPSNILLDEERGPLLTDFGFARLLGASSVSLSLSGGILGTPAYIAPEVWELNAAQPAVDIYALGCIAYEMLTGEALFRGETPMQVMRAHDKGPRFPKTWPEGVPAGIEEVLGKALQRDPGSRYPSAAALHYALQDLERKAQAEREAAERAEVAAQWRAETEAAMAAEAWSSARMAVGRWLAVEPDDPGAQQAQTEIEGQLAPEQVKQEEPSPPQTGVQVEKAGEAVAASKAAGAAVRVPAWGWLIAAAIVLVLVVKAGGRLGVPVAIPAPTPRPVAVAAEPTTSTPILAAPSATSVVAKRPTVTGSPKATESPTLPPLPAALVLSIEIVDQRSWVLVMADGERAFAGILEPGAKDGWMASERIMLRSGNAGAVRVTLNGEDLGLFGELEQVVEQEWTAPGVSTRTPERTALPANEAPPEEPKCVSTPAELQAGGTCIWEDGSTMILIPAGSFLRGSSERELAIAVEICNSEVVTGKCSRTFSEETPQHSVYLDSFWIDQDEITNRQYKVFVDSTGHRTPFEQQTEENEKVYPVRVAPYNWHTGTYPSGRGEYPVVLVNWEDAQAYCQWAGKRLPSEAEWEKAARGTDARIFPWGDQWEEDCAPRRGYENGPAEVGSFPCGRSPYGVFDMAGNVSEWVADWYSDTYYEVAPAANPMGLGEGWARVVRGGWFAVIRSECRCSSRSPGVPSSVSDAVGFRCALSASP